MNGITKQHLMIATESIVGMIERQRQDQERMLRALQSGECLAAVALLDTDVNVVLLRPNVVLHVKRVSLVGEGVYRRANERIVCQQRC